MLCSASVFFVFLQLYTPHAPSQVTRPHPTTKRISVKKAEYRNERKRPIEMEIEIHTGKKQKKSKNEACQSFDPRFPFSAAASACDAATGDIAKARSSDT